MVDTLDAKVDGKHRGRAALASIAFCIKSAASGAVTDSDDPFGRRHGVVGPQKRLAHVLRHRAGHEQHVGMARRGDEAQSEAFEIVIRIAQGIELKFAGIARTRIDEPERQAAAQPTASLDVQFGGHACDFRIGRSGPSSR